MAGKVTRDEFNHLRARVEALEHNVAEKKRLNRLVLEQVRRNGDDLATIKSKLDCYEERSDGLAHPFDRLDQKLDILSDKFDVLRQTLPRVIRDVMRKVLRERGGRI